VMSMLAGFVRELRDRICSQLACCVMTCGYIDSGGDLADAVIGPRSRAARGRVQGYQYLVFEGLAWPAQGSGELKCARIFHILLEESFFGWRILGGKRSVRLYGSYWDWSLPTRVCRGADRPGQYSRGEATVEESVVNGRAGREKRAAGHPNGPLLLCQSRVYSMPGQADQFDASAPIGVVDTVLWSSSVIVVGRRDIVGWSCRAGRGRPVPCSV